MRIVRALKWVAINGSICFCAWNGYVNSVKMCENIFSFASVVIMVIGILIFMVKKETVRGLVKNGPALPLPILAMSDLFLIVICAAYGHYLFASAWLISMLADQRAFGKETDK